ncbi:MAG: NACHT domain-containing NTPase [Oscillatoria sp. PMC 1068.18]|nr:NACHT domain-containing NTPase [Oscillatoria sp. PMC 1076.18]MEC4990487.1 NACHT domain-containing NTPase [Oscillatoria sp. PMC 1068.18]
MAKRSLKLSKLGKQKTSRAFQRTELTQQQLAEEVGCTRQTVGKFFAGKPVEKWIFQEICFRLNLDWEEVTEFEDEPKITQVKNLDTLVNNICTKLRPSLQNQCGTIRALDMSRPIEISDIYTEVNILEKIPRRKTVTIAQLLQQFSPEAENFDPLGINRLNEERCSAEEAVLRYPKLTILGKPGAGKTTFLKYLALQCSYRDFLGDLVPIFIVARSFAEAKNQPTLKEYISKLLLIFDVDETQTTKLLAEGRSLILIDGIDEVKGEDVQRVYQEIRDFYDQYHRNRFAIACRTAIRESTLSNFTEVEIADFSYQQIESFVQKWFLAKSCAYLGRSESHLQVSCCQDEETAGNVTCLTKNGDSETVYEAEEFLAQLQANPRIQELATNPLLLTLLCLEFEDSGDFPSDRAELYRSGIATLMRKWDAKRGIVRDRVYQKLSVQRKKDLLANLALATFERQEFLFKQKEIEKYIADYLCNLTESETDSRALQLDSAAVVKSIETQHGILVERAKGIYSFSHLSFQEYFTARKIITSSSPQELEKSLNNLVARITEKNWREIFLLAVGMLPKADCLLLLMKAKIDSLLAKDAYLQEFLAWVNEKSHSLEIPFKPAAVRAFYFNLARIQQTNRHPKNYRNCELVRALDRNLFILVMLGNIRALDIGFDEILTIACDRAQDLQSTDRPYAFAGAFALACDRAIAGWSIPDRPHNYQLGQALQTLKQQLPDPNKSESEFQQWWQQNGTAWTNQLRAITIESRNLGHNWQFTPEQAQTLKNYYEANQLLVECLNSDCYITREIRQEIEATLLLFN